MIIQDADLEYDPGEYQRLIEMIEKGEAEVVYGSRFLGRCKGIPRYRKMGNRFLTFLTNLLFGSSLTDTASILNQRLLLKFFRQGHRIYEVPITYCARGSFENKKIGWKDGLITLCCLIKYRLFG